MLQQRRLGNEGLEVSAISLGTMMMPDNDESVRTIHGALDLGVTMFDTADLYGTEFLRGRFWGNEKLVGRALKGRRDKAVIASKFGVTHGQGPKGDPAYIKKSVDASLYSPLGRGFLTGQIKTFEDLPEDDYRRYYPRFQGENFIKNIEIVSLIETMASQRDCTPAQLSLAWLLAQGEQIVPIPGTKRLDRVQENLGSLQVKLTVDDLSEIEHISPKGVAAGSRIAAF